MSSETPDISLFVGSDFSDRDYDDICFLLRNEAGFDPSAYQSALIKRRIAARMRQTGCAQPALYRQRLSEDAAEMAQLLAQLPVQASRFFRDPEVFDCLAGLLPALAAACGGRLRCWSAGCAGGEEAYSLALLLDDLELLPATSILASDADARVVAAAAAGRFSAERLAGLTPEQRRRLFRQSGAGIEPRFGEKIDFFVRDLHDVAPYPAADLIFCRYVLCYFSPEQQVAVIRRFAAALPAGGLFVLGRSEVLRDPEGLFRPVDGTLRIYTRS